MGRRSRASGSNIGSGTSKPRLGGRGRRVGCWSGLVVGNIAVRLVPTFGSGIPVHGFAINDALAILVGRRRAPLVRATVTIAIAVASAGLLLGLIFLTIGLNEGFVLWFGAVLDGMFPTTVPTDGLPFPRTAGISREATSRECRGASVSCSPSNRWSDKGRDILARLDPTRLQQRGSGTVLG